MSDSLFSQSWYRVAPLKPRLRSHVRIYRHCYRGEDWYVIQDRFTGRHHRFSAEAFQLIGLMDGRRSLGAIWQTACAHLDAHMPTQDEVIGLLAKLSASDLLQTSSLPDFVELEQRQKRGRRNRLLASIRSPIFLRIPLLDPDRFLDATISLVRPFLGRVAAGMWLIVVVFAVVLVVVHWQDLTNNFIDQVLRLENIILVGLLYPLLKILHEFAHAYMVKKWGGEVHEMGVLLLVFMPIPYMDASSSLSFREKHKRMLVAAAGILVEVLVAALALFAWLNVQPGALRTAAFNTMLIAGVSTILFNGNPLLRFDAYYVLSDFLEIPNLAQKSSRYLGYLIQRYLIGIQGVEPLTESRRESWWLVSYGILSFCYRIFISIRIILFVAGKFFVIGLLLSAWVSVTILLMPLLRVVGFLMRGREMRKKRVRILFAIVLPLFLLGVAAICIPLPHRTLCEGVIWAPEESQVHAGVDGFVLDIVTPGFTVVEQGELLLRLENPELDNKVRLLSKRKEEYKVRYTAMLVANKTDALLLQEELAQVEVELDHAFKKQQSLSLHSTTDGLFVLADEIDLPGRFVRRGETIGYVLDEEDMSVRVVVPQEHIELVRGRTAGIELRLAHDINRVYPASIVREIPAAGHVLPSMALSLEGGGDFALDPRESQYPKVLERIFQFDIKTNEPIPFHLEERVYVRFEHYPEPLFYRWYRDVQRLLLRRFAS